MKLHEIKPLKEAFEDPTFTPQEAAALTKARQSGDPADWDVVDDRELNYKLFRIFSDSGEMPYGVAKARTGDPSNWIADRLERMSDMEFAGFVRNHTAQAAPRLARGKGIGA